jgi:hypothetical protein
MKQFVVPIFLVLLAIGLAETKKEKEKNPFSEKLDSLWSTVYPRSGTGGSAANRAFLSKRSNACNPNHKTFNPTSQQRAGGPFAPKSRARAAQANKDLQSQSRTGGATFRGGVTGVGIVVGKLLVQEETGEKTNRKWPQLLKHFLKLPIS